MPEDYRLPETFSISFRESDSVTFQLLASQVLPISPEKAFSFFEDPRNLFEITPAWLDFRMLDPKKAEVFEGARFEYTIRWLSLRFAWQSRIDDYRPPERFTDVQIKGPYRSWSHLHTFTEVPEGTLMEDKVTYRLPFSFLGRLFHRIIIMNQLRDIFCYRAVRIAEWAERR
jgi:ligand-binding SRPBCC domain-containing protein